MLEGLAASGYNIWYDHGIEISTTWSDEIANAIMGCEFFIVFVSKDSMASNYVRSEVEFALSKNIKVVPVYLQGVGVLPPGLALALHSTQGVDSGDTDDIVSKLCNWLAQNIKIEPWQPIKSSIGTSPQYISAVKKQQVRRDVSPAVENGAGEGEDNFWRSGLYGNQEEYERYLVIKRNLEGGGAEAEYASGSGPHAVSSRPFMATLLYIIFFTGVSEILRAYLDRSFSQVALAAALINWALPSVIFLWYFFLRSTTRISFVGKVLPGSAKFQPLLHWLFLLGWLLSRTDPEIYKVWLPYMDKALRLVRLDLNLARYAFLSLPQIPGVIRSAASLIYKASGAWLFFDAAVTSVMSFLPKRA